MKAHVDKETCIGCTLCTSVCPEIFKMDDDGKSIAYGKVTDSNKSEAKDAEAQCPVSAISVTE